MIIPYGKQSIDKSDTKAVVDVLNSEFLTTGPKINEFEKSFARFVGAKYAIAVSNGTAALHQACLAAGLKNGDELITSPMTFAASANCALYCRAKPVFVDIKENGLIDENLIEEKITSRTKIIIPVHLGGLPCDLKRIKTIAKKHKLIVIEDACHALGSKYKNTKIGDCKYSDMAIFSFHPVKHITTGEGGMITTNSKILYEKLLLLRSHGITKDPTKFVNKCDDPWYCEMQDLGFNYRITDFQCALGISQLKKVKEFIKRRIEIAKTYDKEFINFSWKAVDKGTYSLSGYKMRTRRQNHRGEVSLAFTIEFPGGKTIAYVTDGEPIQESVEFVRGVNLLLHEHEPGSKEAKSKKLEDHIRDGHVTTEGAALIAREAAVKRLYLIHHNPFLNNEKLEKELTKIKPIFKESKLAKDLEVIEF